MLIFDNTTCTIFRSHPLDAMQQKYLVTILIGFQFLLVRNPPINSTKLQTIPKNIFRYKCLVVQISLIAVRGLNEKNRFSEIHVMKR